MFRVQFIVCLLVWSIGALILSAPALADTVLFSDTFEGNAAVSYASDESAGWADAYNSAPLGGSPGSWSITRTDPRQSYVTSYSTPGAATGSKYLTLSPWAGCSLEAWADFADQSTVGDRMHYEANIRIDSTSNATIAIDGYDSAHTNMLFNLGNNGTGVVCHDGINEDFFVAGVSITPGIYQKWQVDYTLGGTEGTLRIGDTSGTFTVAGTSIPWGSVVFTQAQDRPYVFLDDVQITNMGSIPEPASGVLVVSVILGLVAYAWRKRR